MSISETESLFTTSISTNKDTQVLNKSYLNLTSISEITVKKSEVCSGILEHKDIIGTIFPLLFIYRFKQTFGLDTHKTSLQVLPNIVKILLEQSPNCM